MALQQPVWKICLGQLGPNLQEAAELANVLQEVSASIQVTGLTRALTARTSTSSGNPTHLSAKERIKRAVPLDIGAGQVPWSQLVAVVSSAALQEPNSPTSHKQPQVLEVNSGGAVYFLFFRLKQKACRQQQQQVQQVHVRQPAAEPLLSTQVLQQQGDAVRQGDGTAAEQQAQAEVGSQDCSSELAAAAGSTGIGHQQLQPCQHTAATHQEAAKQDVQQQPGASPSTGAEQCDTQTQPTLDRQQAVCSSMQQSESGTASQTAGTDLDAEQNLQQEQPQQQQQQQQQPFVPLLHLHQQRSAPTEAVVVLKVGASRLAMQAEQFANELTRHLGIAAPDCRIVRQVGSSAAEWSAVLAAVQRLAEHLTPTGAAPSTNAAAPAGAEKAALDAPLQAAATGSNSGGGSHTSSTASGGSIGSHSSGGCQAAAELLAELSHLPCFLLMEFVEGSKLSDCPQALDPAVGEVGQLCEDVGRLFLLDMLLGNADRMACPELGWRGNPNNLLYAMRGSRHAGRAVAIDSCVARRPPALKASAEDAAVERLSQLVLSVPGVSMALLQQLLGALRQEQQKRARAQLQLQRLRQSLPGAVGLCTQLSIDSFAGSSSGQSKPSAAQGHTADVSNPHNASSADTATQTQSTAVVSASSGSPLPLPGLSRGWKTSLGGLRLYEEEQEAAAGVGVCEEACFSPEEVARFQAGLRQCLDGVLQIKGLLEMVSAKIAEWIAEFVDDVVRLNPALLPAPASPAPAALLRSPKPSPRPSARGSLTSIRLEPAYPANNINSSIGGLQDAAAATGPACNGPSNGSSSSKVPVPSTAVTAAASPVGPGGFADGVPGRLRLRAAAASPEPAAQHRPLSLTTAVPALAIAPAAASPAASPAGLPAAAVASPPQPSAPPAVVAAAAAAGEGQCRASHDSIDSPAPSGQSLGCSSDCGGAEGVSTTPTKGLFKQLVESSKKEKTQLPLARRFAAIRAAICSPSHSSTRRRNSGAKGKTQPPAQLTPSSPATPAAAAVSSSADGSCTSTPTPPLPQHRQQSSTPCSPHNTSVCGSRSGASPGLDIVAPSSSDLATAVAAALSPRTDALQAEALVGLLGRPSPSGRLHRSLNGAVGSSSEWPEAAAGAGGAAVKPPCNRRVTWCSVDEASGGGGSGRSGPGVLLKSGGGTSILDTHAHKGTSSGASCTSPNALPVVGWTSSPSATALLPAAAAAAVSRDQGSSNTSSSSRNSSASSPVPGLKMGAPHHPVGTSPFAPLSAREGSAAGPPSFSSPPPGGVGHFDSFIHRQYNTRHLSFTSGGGEGNSGSTSTSPAPGLQPPQQRSSSSSLQVLASLQLDATLASITQEARHDGALAERLAHWKARFKERGAELSAAIAAWQQRHQLAAVLSTGFLDGSHPIVDAYELGVRLQHMLRRLTALAAGALVQVPIAVLPGVFLGNAVAADSHHLLQYLGVTHVLNAAQELQLTPDPGMFHVLRVAIRDEEEEDVAAHFDVARSWIDAALSAGGAVLVHCHEGKSRSVTLLLAYLMISRGLTLAAALQHLRAVHPKASPNAGFMAQLMRLDQQLHGACSIQPSELPRSKPEARICSICGAAAGISYASLVRHTKAKHGLAKPPPARTPPAVAATGALAASAPARRERQRLK